jgi:hypothetical protein
MAVLFKEDFLTKVTAVHFASGGAVMLIRGSEDVSFHNEPFKGKFDFFYSSEPDIVPSTIPLLNAPSSLPKFTAPTGPVALQETITSDMKNAFYMWRYPSAVVNDSGARFWQSVTVFNFGKIKSKLATAALAQSSTRLNLGMTFSWAGGGDPQRVITNRFLINVATFKNIKALRPTLAAVDTVLDVVDGTPDGQRQRHRRLVAGRRQRAGQDPLHPVPERQRSRGPIPAARDHRHGQRGRADHRPLTRGLTVR